MYKGCETEPTVYHPYPRRLQILTVCKCQHFFLSYFETLSVGPAGVSTSAGHVQP